LDLLDAHKHGYLIKVKLKNLVVLLTRQQWTAIAGQPDWEQCTFDYRCGEWKVTRHFVAVRRKQLKEQSPKLIYWKRPNMTMTTSVMSRLKPLRLGKPTKNTANALLAKPGLKESKGQMGNGQDKNREFLANAALFHCAVLALQYLALDGDHEW